MNEFLSVQNFWLAVDELFRISADPSRRTYWVFLLSALLLALLVLYIDKLRNKAAEIKLNVHSYWLHRSHLTDIGYFVLNTFLKILLVIPLLGGHIAATIFVASALQSGLGDAPVIMISTGAVVLLYTLTFFLFEDLSRFTLHKAMHEVSWLWGFHRVHHSAQVLSPLTLFRVHPLEMLLYYLRSLLVFGSVSGVFVYLFGKQVDGYDILGVDALGFLFNLIGANLRHSHIWLTFGLFERWFISPAQHQIHHSIDISHRNKNYGTCLAIWDRVNGSWVSARNKIHLIFGIPA